MSKPRRVPSSDSDFLPLVVVLASSGGFNSQACGETLPLGSRRSAAGLQLDFVEP